MVIYGVALLSISTLVGVYVGELLGKLLGVNANVGGVGIAILLLLLITDYLKKKNKLTLKSEEGLKFWSGMYIPIVVAMAAQQNVLAALKGGPVAILAAISAVAFSYALVPILSKGNQQKEDIDEPLKKELHI